MVSRAFLRKTGSHFFAARSIARRAVLRVADGDRERVGGVRSRCGRRGQQHPHHHRHLLLFRVADADDGLLDEVGGVFGDRQPAQRQRGQRNAARLPELQRRLRIAIEECLLDRRLVRAFALDKRGERPMDRRQALRERSRGVGLIEPQPTKPSRDPAASITPHPVKRRPGSTPRMRIAPVVMRG